MPSSIGTTSSAFVIRNRWAWGAATNGQLGNNTTTPNTDAPLAVNTEGDWAAIAPGATFTLGIRLGRLYSWGNNANGRTGQGTASGSTNTPTQIGSDADWVKIAAGGTHGAALKSDGTLWTWGQATNGRLGNNTTTPDVTSPTKIGTDTDWTAIDLGNTYSLALKSNGTLWAWGGAANGRLGNGTTTPDVLVPTQIGADTDWRLVCAGGGLSFAIKTNGSLYSWGNNQYGATAQGTTTGNTTTPTQVGSDTDWEQIAATSHVVAVKGGQLYGWGLNANGAVGDNSTTDRGSAQLIDSNTGWKVGEMTNFQAVQQSAAIRAGKLYTWGGDTTGMLGNGAGTADVLVPTQVGSDSDWQDVAMSQGFTTAIKG